MQCSTPHISATVQGKSLGDAGMKMNWWNFGVMSRRWWGFMILYGFSLFLHTRRISFIDQGNGVLVGHCIRGTRNRRRWLGDKDCQTRSTCRLCVCGNVSKRHGNWKIQAQSAWYQLLLLCFLTLATGDGIVWGRSDPRSALLYFCLWWMEGATDSIGMGGFLCRSPSSSRSDTACWLSFCPPAPLPHF